MLHEHLLPEDVPPPSLARNDAEPWHSPVGAARTRHRVSLPDWARDAPHRCLYLSNPNGTFELYAWDRERGTTRQVTDRPEGTSDGALSPDGEQVWWFDDTGGDGFGRWRWQPFEGGPDVDATPGVPDACPAGLEIGSTLTVVGCSTDEGSTVHVVRPECTSVLYRSEHDASFGGLSRSQWLVVLEHSEHGARGPRRAQQPQDGHRRVRAPGPPHLADPQAPAGGSLSDGPPSVPRGAAGGPSEPFRRSGAWQLWKLSISMWPSWLLRQPGWR